MQLTESNYQSIEVNRQYMSSTQFGDWITCEEMAFAIYVTGEYKRELEAFNEGHFLHSLNEGKRDEYIKAHPEIKYKGKDSLKGAYAMLDKGWNRAMEDRFFRLSVEGEKEKFFTANWCGIEWKCKVDVINHEHMYICDVKKTKGNPENRINNETGLPFFSPSYCPQLRRWVEFYEAYNYWRQLAIYQKIVELSTGKLYDIYIAAVTKQDPVDYDVFDFNQYPDRIENELDEVERNIERIILVKADAIERIRCGKCEYCRKTKKITKITVADSYQ